MATVKQIKESLFLISWSVVHKRNFDNSTSESTEDFDLKKYFENYRGTLVTKRDQDGYSLTMEIIDEKTSKPVSPPEFKIVLAKKDDDQQKVRKR